MWLNIWAGKDCRFFISTNMFKYSTNMVEYSTNMVEYSANMVEYFNKYGFNIWPGKDCRFSISTRKTSNHLKKMASLSTRLTAPSFVIQIQEIQIFNTNTDTNARKTLNEKEEQPFCRPTAPYFVIHLGMMPDRNEQHIFFETVQYNLLKILIS